MSHDNRVKKQTDSFALRKKIIWKMFICNVFLLPASSARWCKTLFYFWAEGIVVMRNTEFRFCSNVIIQELICCHCISCIFFQGNESSCSYTNFRLDFAWKAISLKAEDFDFNVLYIKILPAQRDSNKLQYCTFTEDIFISVMNGK